MLQIAVNLILYCCHKFRISVNKTILLYSLKKYQLQPHFIFPPKVLIGVLQASLLCVILIGVLRLLLEANFMSINNPTFSLQFSSVMAKMKKMPRQNPPEPNPFIHCKMSETHIITTSNPASPREPQPTRAVETTEQQVTPIASVEETPAVVIQPAPSGEEETEKSCRSRTRT